ncbi:MAG: hypothetical protein NWQ38_13425 [Cellulophaga sp.]|nr:hypothetical protein [Cellulophaga sp.]
MVNSIRSYLVLFWIVFFSVSLYAQDFKKTLFADNIITIIDATDISNDNPQAITFGKSQLFIAIETAGGSIQSVTEASLTNQKMYLVLGTLENNLVKKMVSNDTTIIPNKKEGVFYQWLETENGTALVVGGTDAKGLMYALNELSQQIDDKGLIAFSEIENTVEYPDNAIRGLDKFITDEEDDVWFFSEEYWQYYIQQLAKNRFNRLTLITGYNDGSKSDFMMPIYPYLVNLQEYNGVQIQNKALKSPEERLKQLRRIGQISHEHGLEFVFGVWSHGRADDLIQGLPEDAVLYTEFCSEGMRQLLRQVPEIDGIQLRVNYESGVGGFGETADNFWKQIITAIGDIYTERQGKLFLDIRAKGITPKIRDWALATGINLHVTSKYSWEGVGLPYHPTEMRKRELDNLDNVDLRQRYGYADFLNKSNNFGYINRLWGIGTLRMFTWADPDFAQRFSHSTSFGGASGFQVTPPLARKKNTWKLFPDESMVYYKWEDERYWAWYELFGRLGYSKDTQPEVWQRTFKKHYGKSYQAVLDAYSSAGKVLPLLTSSHLTYHPANYNWAEIESGGALFIENSASIFHKEKERTYQSAEPGDPGLFYGINGYVKDVLNNDVQPKINPVQLSALYEKLANETLAALSNVNKEDIPAPFLKEFLTNEMDIKITAALSLYHSYKIKAATDFAFYKATQNKSYLKSALLNMKLAQNYWKEIVQLTEKLYYKKPLFLTDNATWNDRLIEIEKDIKKLVEIIGDSKNTKSISHWDNFKNTNNNITNNFEAIVPKNTSGKEALKVTLITQKSIHEKQIPQVHYRIANMTAGKFKPLKMTWNGTNYIAEIPAQELNPEYDLLLYFTAMTNEGNVSMYPGLLNEKHHAPYYVVNITE